jgi:amidase
MDINGPISRRALLGYGLASSTAAFIPDLPIGELWATPTKPLRPRSQPLSVIGDEPWVMAATELAAAIRDRRITSHAVVESHLERIAKINPRVNAITEVLDETAMRGADEADRAVENGAEVGPLHGVPFTIKENIDVAGSATSMGVLGLEGEIAPVDAPLVTQLKAAGAIPLARTNMPDFGLRWHTKSSLHGATANPWDRTRTPGGSSGGEAAALALGMTPLGVGNDYGGSARYPAQCCGVCSIRPTRGRVPDHSAMAPAEFPISIQLFMTNGPMARHVRDLRVALAAMSGSDPRDPWWVPAPLEGPSQGRPIKVAMTTDPGGEGTDPDVADGVRRAADALSNAGYAIEEVELPAVAEAAALWARVVAAEIRTDFVPAVQELLARDSEKVLNDLFAVVPQLSLRGYMRALADRNGIARQWTQFAQEYPLILGPVSTEQPFAVGDDLKGREAVLRQLRSMRLVVIANLLGLPAAVVPVGLANELPQAVQVIGSLYREDLCLDAAEAIESELGVLTPIDPQK